MGQRDYFANKNPEGKDPWDRTHTHGLETFTEHIAAGLESPGEVMEQFKTASASLCNNMMDSRNNRYGVGFAEVLPSTYWWYWTQLLARDKTGLTADTSCLCEDAGLNYCVYYVSQGYCYHADYGPWMEANCAKSCGQCSACEDMASACQGWKASGYCEHSSPYWAFMHQNCKQTCELC